MPASCVCEGGGLRAALREDLDRYVYRVQRQHGVSGRLVPIRHGLLTQGLWGTAAYRWHHWARNRRRLLLPVAAVLHRLVATSTGVYIDRDAHVGPGLKVPHGGNIVVGPVRIGTNCDLYHNVTLGAGESAHGERRGGTDVPTLGDRVWVGPGAVVAGGVDVGDDAVVSANSLLVRDVPDRGVVIGVPARLVSRQGSFAQVVYRTMDSDDERKLALAELETGAGPAS